MARPRPRSSCALRSSVGLLVVAFGLSSLSAATPPGRSLCRGVVPHVGMLGAGKVLAQVPAYRRLGSTHASSRY